MADRVAAVGPIPEPVGHRLTLEIGTIVEELARLYRRGLSGPPHFTKVSGDTRRNGDLLERFDPRMGFVGLIDRGPRFAREQLAASPTFAMVRGIQSPRRYRWIPGQDNSVALPGTPAGCT